MKYKIHKFLHNLLSILKVSCLNCCGQGILSCHTTR